MDCKVGIGSKLKITDGDGWTEVIQLVLPHEADLESGLISSKSPLGKTLRNGSVGDIIAVESPAGLKKFTIDRVENSSDSC